MPNILKADCGFNPHDMEKPFPITVEQLGKEFDISPYSVLVLDVTGETGPFDPVDFINLQEGMEYKLLLKGAASDKELLTFHDGWVTSSFVDNIAVLDGESFMYKFVRIGDKIYVDAVGYTA